MYKKKISDYFYKNLKLNPKKFFLFIDEKPYNYEDSLKDINLLLKIFKTIKCKNVLCITKNEFTFFNILISISELNLSFSPFSNLTKSIFFKKIIETNKFDCLILDKVFYQNIDIKTQNLLKKNIQNIILINDKKISILKKKISKVKKNNFFLLCYTSGSTGQPKSILLSQKTKILRSNYVIDLYDLSQNDKILITTPLHHTLAFRKLIICLILNSECHIKSTFDPNDIIKYIKEKKISFTMMVPSQLEKIFKSKKNKSKISIQNIVSSSSTLSLRLKKKVINNINGNFHECYGTSETSILTNINLSKDIKNLNTIGKKIKGVHLKTKKENKLEGELLCKTPLIFSGYLKNGIITKHKKKSYFNTGDIVKIKNNNYLIFQSRKHEIMKVGAITVYPKDIEQVLLNNKNVANCAVFSVQDKKFEEKIVAIIEKNLNSHINQRDILHYCHNKIENYQMPKIVKFVKKIPLNNLGKINKINLEKKLF